jgi:hypothetical protein
MMRRVKAFAMFWWDFVVGDDWTVAAGVAVAFATTALLAHAGVPAWWLVPAVVTVLMGIYLVRATRRSGAPVSIQADDVLTGDHREASSGAAGPT